MIIIKHQDSKHQYDCEGNQITTWNEKCCEWIVNDKYLEDYEQNNIDWWGRSNDFPRGISMKEFIKNYGDPNKIPDICLISFWDNDVNWRKFTRDPLYPWKPDIDGVVKIIKNWGYLNYTKEEAISKIITNKDSYYNNVCKFSSGCELMYNGEIIYKS